jgi:flagellar protein FliO/FliZ
MTDLGLAPLASFAIVIALIPVALWLLKRTPMGGAAQGRGLRSVAVLSLSASQRIVTVEVGTGEDRRWLVLGVTPNGINTLHTMTPQGEEAQPVPVAQAAFGDLLARLRGVPKEDQRAR